MPFILSPARQHRAAPQRDAGPTYAYSLPDSRRFPTHGSFVSSCLYSPSVTLDPCTLSHFSVSGRLAPTVFSFLLVFMSSQGYHFILFRLECESSPKLPSLRSFVQFALARPQRVATPMYAYPFPCFRSFSTHDILFPLVFMSSGVSLGHVRLSIFRFPPVLYPR